MTRRSQDPPRSSRLSVAACIAAATLAVCTPLLTHGPLPQGSDALSTSHYLQGFMKALSEGELYPRWTDRTNQDLGAPSFVMFPPLTYYGAALATWLAGSMITGLKLYLLLVSLLSALALYLLAREWIGPGLPAAVAAGLYLLLPYHVLDMYQRFAMSETTAFIFLPLILLLARRLILVGGLADFIALSVSYAALVYTHIVSALMFSLLLGPWLLWECRHRWAGLVRPCAALACGLGLAVPALLPAVMEKAYANIAWIREMPNGDFRINFIFKDEILPGLGFKDPVKPPVLKSAHSQLLLAALSAGLALAWTPAAQRRRRLDVMVLAVGCAAAYFLQLEISTPVWRLVPELASIQFPWRFQTMMVLTAGLLAGFALSAGWGRPAGGKAASRSLIGPGPLGLGLVLAGNLALAWQNAHLKSFTHDESVLNHPRVVHWVEPAFTPVEFKAYRRFRETQLEMPRAAFAQGDGVVEVKLWASSSRRLAVQGATGGKVVLRSFWFPGWVGRLDGAPLDLKPAPPHGVVSFEVPPGSHEITLEFEPTPMRRQAALLGLGSLLVTPLMAWWLSRSRGLTPS